MNLDDYTKELSDLLDDFREDAILYGEELHHDRVKSDDEIKMANEELLRKQSDLAAQIAKEVQRREIKAKLDVMHWAMKGHSVDSEDYCKTMQREINQLEQQLKELEEKK